MMATTVETLEVLAKCYETLDFQELREILAADCEYVSGSAAIHIKGGRGIYSFLSSIAENITEQTRYYAVITEIAAVSERMEKARFAVGTPCIALAQYEPHQYVAQVFVETDKAGKIMRITVSKDHRYQTAIRENGGCYSVISGVKPQVAVQGDTITIGEMLTMAYGEEVVDNIDKREHGPTQAYNIWQAADGFFLRYLKDQGLVLERSEIEEECIAYAVTHGGKAYTIFMFAFGDRKTTQLDGKLCAWLKTYDIAQNKRVLVAYLHVTVREDGPAVKSYRDSDIELWELKEIGDTHILAVWNKGRIDYFTSQVIAAFNSGNRDLWEFLFEGSFCYDEDSRLYMNAGMISCLKFVCQEHGRMELCYVRLNDVVYMAAPYVKDYGYFDISYGDTGRISRLSLVPPEHQFSEVIHTGEFNVRTVFDDVPKAVSCEFLQHEETQRFAVKVRFGDGSVKKYKMPFNSCRDEVVSYQRHVFTDKIFANGYLEDNDIRFINGYRLLAARAYLEGSDFSEPEVCREVVYKDDRYRIEKLWQWKDISTSEDEKTGILMVSLPGKKYFNLWPGYATFASIDGCRLTNLDFHIIDGFHEGLASVYVGEPGDADGRFTFVDKDIKFLTKEKYRRAEGFSCGRARVERESDGKVIHTFIDREGREHPPRAESERYKRLEDYSDGLARVSLMEKMNFQLAYHSDYEDDAGLWGYIDKQGAEVISPQYIYALNFHGGRAMVAKGGWTKDPKWDNSYNTGRYWTETELWGIIDKDGKEVVPCCYDEIESVDDDGEYFKVHSGGWEEGGWGLVNKDGNWVVPPIFPRLGLDITDDCIVFCEKDDWADETPEGVYSIAEQKIVLEAKYGWVNILSSQLFLGEKYSEKHGKVVTILCGRDGVPRFDSQYSRLVYHQEVGLLTGVISSDRHADDLFHESIDLQGNLAIACRQPTPFDGIDFAAKTIVCWENGKLGMRDFDDNVIIPHVYEMMQRVGNGLIKVSIKSGEKILYGLMDGAGKQLLPVQYDELRVNRSNFIFAQKDGVVECFNVTISFS